MTPVMRLAVRMLGRDWRAGELRVLALALVVAVASVTSVTFVADRIWNAMVRDAHQLLGGDVSLQADQPWPREFAEEIARRGLARAESVNLASMAQANGQSLLAGVKAVTDSYPLRGRLRSAPGLNQPDAPAPRGPARGTVWLDERLTSALGVVPGERVKLGNVQFPVAAVLTLEPDRGANFFNIAPRLMMNKDDLPATGLIQTGSRVTYQLLAAGDRKDVDEFSAWAKQRLGRGQRLESLENARPEVRNTIDRAQSFLGLTALLAAVLAGVAIALGTRRFVERHLDGCAVMRCLGASQSRLLALYGTEFLLLGLGACAAGCVLGYAAHALIVQWIAGILQVQLPPASPLPALQGYLVGLVLLLGFSLPPLIQLKNVPAVRVMRRESGAPRGGALAAYAAGFASLAGLLVWQAGNVKLGAIVVGGFATAVVVFVAAGWLALRAAASGAVARALGARSMAVRLGLASLRRHSRSNAVQVASLALGLTAILLLSITRADLIGAWRRAAPPDAPNRFMLNIQPDQVAPLGEFFASNGIPMPDLYPMIRGRLTEVNGKPVSEQDYADERARRLVEREFNLSYSAGPPPHNRVTAGRWFDAQSRGAAEISIEEGLGKTLGLKLGDAVTFNIAGEPYGARITSLRGLKWDSMKVNFFVIGQPSALERYPTSWITSFRLAPQHEPLINRLVARFPNLTIVDVGAALKQLQAVLDQVIVAVQFVFLFALAAGLLVLYAALVATEDERRREAAVMRAFGASSAQIAGAQRTEFAAMGLVAGLLATVGALAISAVLARRVFELDLPANGWLWIAGPLAGLALLSLNAWLSSRKVLRMSPALTLRDTG